MTISAPALNIAPATSVYLDDRTALHLSHAFHQEQQLESLLALLFSQLRGLTSTTGLIYEHRHLTAMQVGSKGLHKANYRLAMHEQDLGEMTLFFDHPQNEQEVQTCEDLLSLAFTALRHCVTLTLALAAQSAKVSAKAEVKSTVSTTPAAPEQNQNADSTTGKADSLLVLALDDFSTILKRDGDAWGQEVLQSVQTQIDHGLRASDGVYQIADNLIAALLPNTTLDQAAEVAKKIRILISSLHLHSTQITACIGISDSQFACSPEQIMANAREALSAAQQQGPSSITCYDERFRAQTSAVS